MCRRREIKNNSKLKDKMTTEQFNNHGFRSGDKVMYKGVLCPIIKVDFEEGLIAVPLHLVCGGVEDETELQWLRYENAEF